jgi:hypothetical protein
MLESRKRIIIILAITVAVEIGLAIMVKLGPALEDLARPVFPLVAAIGAVTAWQAARRRRSGERRHEDRRHR